MSRSKKTRKISDIMPARKAEKKPYETSPKPAAKKGKKPSRYELDLQAREAKKARKHKGLPTGSRNADPAEAKKAQSKEVKDPRIGSRKKVPLMVEFVNQPEKGKVIPPVKLEAQAPKAALSAEQELEQLENNECLNQLLDELEAGKTLSKEDAQFVESCLSRIEELMTELGITEEDVEDEGDALLRQFERMDINQFR